MTDEPKTPPEATDEDATPEEAASADAASADAAGQDDAQEASPKGDRAGATASKQGAFAFEGVDESEVLAEFGDYDVVEDDDDDDEPREDDGQGAEGGVPAETTPKERRLAEMRLEARIESIIFASQKPLKEQEILDLVGDPTVTLKDIERSLDELVSFYETRNGGFRLHYLKRLGYQFQTADDAAAIMERMFASRPRPISRAALETLAIIAYRQPVTRAEVEFIRGVDAGSIFKTLLERDLIKCVGRKEIVGRPMLFGTTDEFLKVFNLSSVKDLPSLESFQPSRELMRDAKERLSEGVDSLVDVEQYIADNVGDGDEPVLPGPDEGEAEDLAADAETEAALEAAPPAPTEAPETTDGSDADTEVAFPTGDSLPEGGGDLDR